MRKERLDAITDAVLAIIVTLLVLEIKIPELTMENTPKILQQIIVYAGSFVTIASQYQYEIITDRLRQGKRKQYPGEIFFAVNISNRLQFIY
jgi:uncharacterized membrane protein